MGKFFWEEIKTGGRGRAAVSTRARGDPGYKGAEASKVAWVEEHDADGGPKRGARARADAGVCTCCYFM